ncbi:MAG: VOC family protein [Burkholderiaceae bacterium]|nr:VOC family protein [Burkholderiaceae bacterium]
MNSTNPKFAFQGLDHIALICSDMAATTDFYHRKLGMPILHTLEYHGEGGEVVGQHFFFGVGDREAHIAMFWWKDGYQGIPKEQFAPLPKPRNPRAGPIGSLLHLNLRVAPDRIEEYCHKLKAEGIDFRHAVRYFDPQNPEVMRAVNSRNAYTPPGENALMDSVYFFDPDGIGLEFNAWLPQWATWPNHHVPLANVPV